MRRRTAVIDNDKSYVRGIDVSHYQGQVSWPAVAGDGVRFAYVKATEGTTNVDPRFRENRAGAAAAGVLAGAYHFFRPDLDARQQVVNYLNTVGAGDTALPPALDVEVANGVEVEAIQAGIRTWLEGIEAAHAVKPVIYTDPTFWRESVAADFGAYPLWIACYTNEPDIPTGWETWTFWQHSASGSVSGITGAVDLDYFALSDESLRQLAS